MSWKKHFTVYNNTNARTSRRNGSVEGYNTRFQSWLPEVYSGMPNRIERYMQYDQMDMDVEINMALDTIAEFSTQIDDETELPFTVKYKKEPTDTETKVLNKALSQWCNINEWDKRIFKTFRNVIKYGDQPFIRDPETWELIYVNPQDVTGVVINESEGKKPAQYILRNLDLNLQDKTATTPIAVNRNAGSTTQSPFSSARTGASTSYNTNVTSLNTSQEEFHVDSSNVVHVALSEGMDANYPFGNSILDSVFKTYKQKELLEDSIIIYRVQRAPERRVFYIDTGDMPPQRAAAFLEKMKMEVHQKRIPNKTGGGSSIMDAQYNPMSILEDYFFSQTCLSLDTLIPLLDGRELTLQEIINEHNEGKENWVYGLSNETHELESAKITWAGVTRKNAKVLKIALDNGESVIATPDHRFITRDGNEVEAKDLTIGESLMPLVKDYSISEQNHKIVDIIELEETIDTGDITIESNSDSHWFGLSAGIYVHNSEGRGSKVEVLPGGQCIALDTKIKLLDGRDLELSEIIKEFEEGKENWVYSVEPSTGKVVGGPITWAGVTRKNAEVVRVTLDNGESIITTPDHKFLLRNGEYIEAETLKSGDSLMPHYERKDNNKVEIYDNYLNTWIDVEKLNDNTNNIERRIEEVNHKVVSVEFLDYRIDTGDITVDGNEIYHNYHNFSVSAGIFISNSLGEIEDLLFFSDKLMRGLRVPNSYMPQQSSNDSGMNFTDGRVGTAFIQEFRFNKYCLRLQNTMQQVFDREFKRFMKHRGFNIDSSMFELQFPEPQSFSDYRQIELDSAKAGVFAQLEGVDYLSRRFILKKYLGLSDSEILENERLYKEENPKISGGAADAGMMDDIGLRGGDDFDDMDLDEEDFGDEDFGGDEELGSPISGAEGAEEPPEEGQT